MPHRDDSGRARRVVAAALLTVVPSVTVFLSGCAPEPETPRTARAASTDTTTPAAHPSASPAASTAPTPIVDPYAGMPLIENIEWTVGQDGPRLLIFPTRAGRDTTVPGAAERAWQEILDTDPGADLPGMWDQFRCHWDWARLVAPDKPSWNLEPWRPAVGYQATVAANCNPGGPER